MKHHSNRILQLIFRLSFLALISCSSDEEVNIIYPEGGYPYPKNISSRDSSNYFLTAVHLIPKRDSFLAFDSKYFFQGFNEENLSLYPPKDDIFRFTFECGFCGKAAIIRLTKNKIVIKKNKLGYAGISIDRDRLSPLEKEHFYLIDRYYPFDDPKHSPLFRKYFNSVLKIYPQLTDLSYFEHLRSKASIIHKMEDKFIIQTIPITTEKFRSFVGLLNNSGFWQRTYANDCTTAPMDGDGFIIEAATKNKYHFVNYNYCQGDDEKSDLRKMINEVLRFIHFDLNAFYSEDVPKK